MVGLWGARLNWVESRKTMRDANFIVCSHDLHSISNLSLWKIQSCFTACKESRCPNQHLRRPNPLPLTTNFVVGKQQRGLWYTRRWEGARVDQSRKVITYGSREEKRRMRSFTIVTAMFRYDKSFDKKMKHRLQTKGVERRETASMVKNGDA